MEDNAQVEIVKRLMDSQCAADLFNTELIDSLAKLLIKKGVIDQEEYNSIRKECNKKYQERKKES